MGIFVWGAEPGGRGVGGGGAGAGGIPGNVYKWVQHTDGCL